MDILLRNMEFMEKLCCYLDLIGFKSAVEKDSEIAFELLNNYQGVLEISKIVNQIFDATKYSSFEDFIPMSDSLFITGINPDSFIKDISEFLVDCYLFDAQNGETQKTLFKGAISFGEIETFTQNCLIDKSIVKQKNILGKGIDSSVSLYENHKNDKGPRIFIDSIVYEKLSKEIKEAYLFSNGNIKELLWPYCQFDNKNEFNCLITKYSIEFLRTSIEQYKKNRLEKWSSYYSEFVKLVLNAGMQAAKNRNSYNEMKDIFTTVLNDEINIFFQLAETN